MRTLFAIACLLLMLTVQTALAQSEPETFHVRRLNYGRVDDLAWSPDGHMLAVAAQKGVYLLNESYEQIAFLPGEQAIWRDITWSHDGTGLGVMNLIDLSSDTRDCYLSLWQGTEIERRLPFCGEVLWGYDHDWLAVLDGRNKRLLLWDFERGQDEPKVFAPVIDAAFSPDGRYLAYANAEGEFTVWNLSESAVEFSLNAAGQSVSWSSDGQYLITTLSTGTKLIERESEGLAFEQWRAFNAIYLWHVDSWIDRQVIEVQNERINAWDSVWVDPETIVTPCSRYDDAFISSNVCVFQRDTQTMQHFTLGGGSGSGSFHEISPDHRYFTAWTIWHGRTLRIGEFEGIEHRQDLLSLPGQAAAWTPDSRFITAVDEEGWLYQYEVEKLDFEQY